ncbi:MAG: PilZ domain-containing protein [Planctomycetes bacterium]|nr:PilZ domain-containing protein [Planctomycetota bacterium]
MVNQHEGSSWNQGRERRRYGRFPARLPVAMRRDAAGNRGRTTEPPQQHLRLRDFSLGGMRAQSAVPLTPNEHLTIRLPPHGKHPQVELTGRVVHCRRQEEGYQVGIEFCQTRPEATASPWHRIFRLFSMALDPALSDRPMERAGEA